MNAPTLNQRQADIIQRALLLTPAGEVPEKITAYADRWYGPACVRVEVTGDGFSEFDDENTTIHGNLNVQGFNEEGEFLAELFTEGEEFGSEEDVRSYFEMLADLDPDREPLRSTAGPCEEGETHLKKQQLELPNGLFYWGPPERDPYRAERALLTELAELTTLKETR